MKHVLSPSTGLYFMLALFTAALLLVATAARPADAQAFGSLAENGTAAFMGIGTVPQKILHVSGSGPGSVPLFSRGSDSAGFIIERTPTNRWVLGVNESPALGNGFVLSTIPTGNTSIPRLMITQDGTVGIGTVSPFSYSKLHVSNDNVTAGRSAILGETAGGDTAGVGGANIAAGTLGFLGGQAFGQPAGAFGSYLTGTTLRNYGVLGRSGYGVYGESLAADIGVYGKSTDDGRAIFGENTNASGYAGYFNGNVKTTGSVTLKWIKVTDNYTVTPNDCVILVDSLTAGHAITITLPSAAGIAGKTYTVKGAYAGWPVTVACPIGEDIDYSGQTHSVSALGYFTYMSDGANWWIVY